MDRHFRGCGNQSLLKLINGYIVLSGENLLSTSYVKTVGTWMTYTLENKPLRSQSDGSWNGGSNDEKGCDENNFAKFCSFDSNITLKKKWSQNGSSLEPFFP